MIRIREFRKALNMTTAQLGSLVGVVPSAITNWETGFRRPDVDMLVKLARVLGCTPNDILGFEEDKPAQDEVTEREVPACVRATVEVSADRSGNANTGRTDFAEIAKRRVEEAGRTV